MRAPVCLVVLDGFGIAPDTEGNAIERADTPFLDRAYRLFPHSRVETSGAAVGLPPGQMGNSEVGHMTLGAGRILDQDISRIQKALDAGELGRNAAFERLLEAARGAGGRLHLLGLISNGGVHSSLGHLDRILERLKEAGIAPVLHAMTDGRDTPPQSALEWIAPLERRIREAGGCIATLAGRYWAMDRDRRWERIAEAYRAIVERRGVEVTSAVEAVEKGYARGEGDEFIRPSVVAGGRAFGDGDAGLFFNFRADRARELTNALTRTCPDKLGPEIERLPVVRPGAFATWTLYDEDFELPAIFPPIEIPGTLGELLSRSGRRQLRIAETEKYAHVTYFFNGGHEEPLPGEDRELIPSPRDVATYDLKPEMSAVQVTDRLLELLDERDYAFILVNYANPDMVGHTGVLPAALRAVTVVDACLERLCAAVQARGGTLLITADHGNIEQMIDPTTGQPHTAHTTHPVPLIWVTEGDDSPALDDGGLSDLAPTLCELLELEPSHEMTGRSLIRCGPPSSSS
jgi:2,3-bisphosphoglycerate-independent phosphoglycerate mutase